MKPGDLVRFRNPARFRRNEPRWLIGLVVEFEKLETPSIVTVLYNDTLHKVTKYNVQKYGRRYLDEKR